MKMVIQGFDEFQRDLKSVTDELPSLLRQAMNKSTRLIKDKVQDKIISEKIPFQGGLQQSVYEGPNTSYRGVVGVGKKYGLYVEMGTRPHWPPIEPLEKWAALKLGAPGAGFLIARKISRKGTKAHPYFVPTIEKSTDAVMDVYKDMQKAMVYAMAGKGI